MYRVPECIRQMHIWPTVPEGTVEDAPYVAVTCLRQQKQTWRRESEENSDVSVMFLLRLLCGLLLFHVAV